MSSNDLGARRARLSPEQRAELARRLQGATPGSTTAAAIPRGARPERLPLSPAQRSLWLTWRLDPASPAYNIAGAITLRGTLNPAALAQAFEALVQRHEILRTVYPCDDDGAPLQHILPGVPLPLLLQHTDVAGPDALTAAQQRIDAFAQQPFALDREGPLRALLCRLGDAEHLLGLSLHHIAGDGWSIGILVDELFALYAAFNAGQPPQLAELPIQFADYAIWQQRWLAAGEHDRQLHYWQQRLGSEHPVIALPLRQPRGASSDDREAREAFHLPPDLSDSLRGLARAQGTSLYVVMLALLKLVLQRFSGQREVRVGTPIANRQKADTHGLIGYLLNLCVLQTRIVPAMAFNELLVQLHETLLQAQAHQDLPFDLLVEALQPARVAGVHPLFQVKCTQQQDLSAPRHLAGLDLTLRMVTPGRAHFDLSLDFTDRADGIHAVLIYAQALFEPALVCAMAETFERLAEQVTQQPQRPVATLVLPQPVLTEPATVWPATDVLALWAAAVAQHAGDVAVHTEARTLTYVEVDEASNRLAAALRQRGVRHEVRVGLHAERSGDFVVAMWAVLKAGGVFVPLDPALPGERLAYQLHDSGAALLLSIDLPAWAGEVPVLRLDDALPTTDNLRPVASAPNAGQAAYVIYTSGSTGRPKGVVVSHGALANYVQALLARLALPAPVRSMAMVSTVAADLGHTVLFGALCSGRTLHLLSAERVFDPDGFAAYMAEHRIDVLKIVPSHLQALLQAADAAAVLPHHTLVLGGESTAAPLLARLRGLRPGCRVVNHYGPTETTVGAVMHLADPAQASTALPLGEPLANLELLVLDGDLNPVPAGVAGELYIGGDGVARGYQGRPGHTAERFVASLTRPGQRCYRTGDRVCLQADGALAFLGRADDQVKVRGHRVETHEVTLALRGLDNVAQAIVVARDDGERGTQLHAYVVSRAGEPIDLGRLRRSLADVLPDHMVPATLLQLAALPLTANGKVDRQALPLPVAITTTAPHAPACSATEQLLAEVWAEVLGVETVGREDDFFALGGDSILALKVVARARRRGLQVLPKQLFTGRTLAAVAAMLAQDPAAPRAVSIAARPVDPRDTPVELSYAQARQWFLWQLDRASTAYHIAGALRLRGGLSLPALQAALDALVARHAALRTLFVAGTEGVAMQRVQPALASPIEEVDVSAAPAEAREAQAQAAALALQQAPFDLEAGPLLRVRLIRQAADEHVLVVVMHHIVSDGWSMQVIVDEFVALYRAQREGRPAALAALPIQYTDYAVWQRHWLQAGEGQRQLAYWQQQLGNEHPVLQLPVDHPRRADGRYRAARVGRSLSASLVLGLHQRAQAAGTTLFTVLLAGVQVLLRRCTGQADIRVGVPIANRHWPETEAVVGFFVNTQVLRNVIDGREPLGQVLARAHDAVQGAQAHQDLPFEQLVEALQPKRHPGTQPLFQVLVNHRRQDQRALQQLPGLSIEAWPLGEQAAQFELTVDSIEDAEGRVHVGFTYAKELFDAATIARLAGHFEAVLWALVRAPQQAVERVSLLSTAQRRQLTAWGEVPQDRTPLQPVHRLIEQQAAKRPEATALVFGDAQMRYGELNSRANRLAHRLIHLGVKPEVKVGLAVERSVEMVVALLAILKAGGAYVPLDPAYPAERLAYMIEDSGIQLLLTQAAVAPGLPQVAGVPRCELEALDVSEGPAHDPAIPLHAQHLAYVIYTSGSTGRPKGAQLCHGNVARLLRATQRWFAFGAQDVWTMFHSHAFDFSVWELFGALCSGARLVIVPFWVSRSPADFLQLLREQRVTVLNLTPSAFGQLMAVPGLYDEPLALRTVIFGGEALDPQRLQPWIDRWGDAQPRLVNMYGITETTVHVTYRPIVAADLQGRRSPVGRAIPDLGLRVLDDALDLAPIGVDAELYVAGAGLARGYLGRPGLSAERFVADPFDAGGGRLYRTGDRVRWNAQGELEYLGRVDQQVKVRGFRIELGEVEAQLLALPPVREAVVVAHQNAGDTRMVAYVSAHAGHALQPDEVRRQLSRTLPEPLLPAVVVVLEALPLNANGKVDRQALPAPVDSAQQRPYEPPQGMVEQALAAIWAEVLGVPRIGRHDHFFELGGHSLMAVQVVARAQAQLQADCSIRGLFACPTLAGFAASVAGAGAADPQALSEIDTFMDGLEAA